MNKITNFFKSMINAIANALSGKKFEVIRYRREDGNVAVYTVDTTEVEPLTKDGVEVGIIAKKVEGTGTSLDGGYRAFRFDRILERKPLTFGVQG